MIIDRWQFGEVEVYKSESLKPAERIDSVQAL